MFPIIDLHCDLLTYLQKDHVRSAFDLDSRCSLPQLRQGNVLLQVFAIFSLTEKDSTLQGIRQVNAFESLKDVFILNSLPLENKNKIYGMLAIENASSFFEEDESLDKGLQRLEALTLKHSVLYLSLTWNHENRFGGGNATNVGLKKDGETLLDFLASKNICIDFSHTSDALAYDILNYMEKNQLPLTPIASHSNFRVVTSMLRNLPEDVFKQIIKKQGVIGLNFVRKFIGEDFLSGMINHINYALERGAENNLCFGADFFYDQDSSNFIPHLNELAPFFHPVYENAACYPLLLENLENYFDEKILKKIAFQNFMEFISKNAFLGLTR